MRIGRAIVRAFLAIPLACIVLAWAAVPMAHAAILIVVDKGEQQMTVSVDGVVRWTWPVSTGIARYDTPNGRYTAFRMEAEHFSKEWDDAPMPHSIFFTMQGHAIHGSLHSKLGQPASHGCVRLDPANAAELYALVEEQGLPNTKVVIEGEIPSAPLVAGRPPSLLPRINRNEEAARLRSPARVREQQAMREPRYAPEPHAYAVPRTYAPPPAYHPQFPLPFSLFAPRASAPPQAYAPRRANPPQPAYSTRRAAGAPPRVYYDPRVQVTEETYVNGVRVRRHYTRPSTRSDFGGWR
jgi:hypothetical protein